MVMLSSDGWLYVWARCIFFSLSFLSTFIGGLFDTSCAALYDNVTVFLSCRSASVPKRCGWDERSRCSGYSRRPGIPDIPWVAQICIASGPL